MKVLNLYAGIGGNRKLWTDCEITAIEYNEQIAAIYKSLYPNDTVIVTDAHEYLLKNFKKFDFIWGSPPCSTHSRLNTLLVPIGTKQLQYPDMKLYQEIILLNQWYEGKWVIENVIPYYQPLIKPQESGRHYFWSNFKVPKLRVNSKVANEFGMNIEQKMKDRNYFIEDWKGYKGDKRTLLNNCVEPEIGLAILNAAKGIIHDNNVCQTKLAL